MGVVGSGLINWFRSISRSLEIPGNPRDFELRERNPGESPGFQIAGSLWHVNWSEKRFVRQLFDSNSTERHIHHSICSVLEISGIPRDFKSPREIHAQKRRRDIVKEASHLELEGVALISMMRLQRELRKRILSVKTDLIRTNLVRPHN